MVTVDETSGELVTYEQPAQAITLFGSDDPDEVIERATHVAKALDGVLQQTGLTMSIQGRKYVKVEGWTFLGNLVGVFPRTAWSRAIDGGWEARVEAVTRDGSIVGAAEAVCMRAEKNWANRDDYALRSMAQTRAMGKALRMPLGFIAVLAGYDPLPADEVPAGGFDRQPDPDPAPVQAGPPGQTLVTFGKHKGQTIGEIAQTDPQYIKWLAAESSRLDVKAAAMAFLADEDIPF